MTHKLPDTLCLTRDWSPLLADMLPCDLATFLQVWGHVQHDMADSCHGLLCKPQAQVEHVFMMLHELGTGCRTRRRNTCLRLRAVAPGGAPPLGASARQRARPPNT